ncbi:MAG: PQQ-dependent sugar dehydrogenase [Flammeovirgaceae bacterium]|nr:PQQ-dependent sugar dehydrogenase [Flammeovirgaceae bacterium]
MKNFLFIVFSLVAQPVLAQPTFSEAFPQISFTLPIEMAMPPDLSNRIFVVQQGGLIKVFPNKPTVTAAEVKTFLNLTPKIISGGERGLLGFAFHPEYASNGFFFVNYTRPSPLTSVISRFQVSASNPDEADIQSEVILFTQSQPYDNHNGGKLAFGNDGYLYISLGDGGSGGDPQNNAQTLTTLLGKILRIDVDNTFDTLNYAFPPDNPFVNNTQGYRKEIYAYGLRNVWKFSIDQTTGTIWAGDVGQNRAEEIDLIVNGGNYGWKIMEGFQCYPTTAICDTASLELPIFEYTRENGDRSITGGYVYRGVQIPEWQGKYIYSDYISGKIWTLAYENNVATTEFVRSAGGNVSCFGEDYNKELYVLIYNTGKIWRFLPTVPAAPSDLILTESPTQNELQWTENSNNELGYIIERSWFYDSNFEVLDTVSTNSNQYLEDIGSDTTHYNYRVSAYNDGGQSEYAYVADIILSTEEGSNKQIRIFPNPSSGTIYIELQQPANVLITDATGHNHLDLQNISGTLPVQLYEGIYIVIVQSRQYLIRQKIVVK